MSYIITGPTDGPQGDRGHSELETRLDLVTDAVIRIGERQLEQERAEKREAHKREVIEGLRGAVKPKAETASAPRVEVSTSKQRISYFKDGKRWNERKGEWVEVNPKSWDSPTFRDNVGKALEVSEPGLPTVVHDSIGPVVRSACILCGVGEVVQDIIRLGRKGGVRGGFCVDHHIAWHKRPLDQPHGLWVTEQLDRAGRLPDDYPRAEGGWIEHYPQRWGQLCWGIRVMRSSDPAAQLPMSVPFGFLNPGPAFRLHDDDREKVDA